jgi:hypothetical protein
MNLRVRGKREEMSFAVGESPEKGVEECPLISRAMAGDGSGEVDKGLGDSGEISGARGEWCFREKSELFAALPKKILRWDSVARRDRATRRHSSKFSGWTRVLIV